MQIKSNSTKLQGIKAFRANYPELSIGTGLILHAGDRCYAVEKDIIALPWNAIQ